MRPPLLRIMLVSCFATLVSSWVWGQGSPAHVPEGINKPFQNPNVKEFVKKFETESREVFAQRNAIVKALGLEPGMAVGDIGAGTGLFTRLIAEQVGPKGKVYAVDIAPSFLAHIAAESKRLGQTQVTTVRGTQQSVELSPDSIDLAFLCDVYHHVERPSEFLATIHRALRPNGHLVVIDFDRVEGKSEAFVLKHVRAPKTVFFSEIEAAGFKKEGVADAPALRENFFAKFQKLAKPAARAPSEEKSSRCP